VYLQLQNFLLLLLLLQQREAGGEKLMSMQTSQILKAQGDNVRFTP
jgi:hypothetical protein